MFNPEVLGQLLQTPEVQAEIAGLMAYWEYDAETDGDSTEFFVTNLLAGIQSQKAAVARSAEITRLESEIAEMQQRLNDVKIGALDDELIS